MRSQCRRLLANVERHTRPLGRDQRQSAVLKALIGELEGITIEPPPLVIELPQQRTATIQPVERQAVIRGQPLDAEVELFVCAIAKEGIVLVVARANIGRQRVVAAPNQPAYCPGRSNFVV